MSLTIELAEDVLTQLNEAARTEGSDPAAYVASLVTARFAIAANIPAYLDPKRFRPFAEFMEEQRRKWGYPEGWLQDEQPLSDEDTAAFEVAFADIYGANK